jgi:hypothetical protein
MLKLDYARQIAGKEFDWEGLEADLQKAIEEGVKDGDTATIAAAEGIMFTIMPSPH